MTETELPKALHNLLQFVQGARMGAPDCAGRTQAGSQLFEWKTDNGGFIEIVQHLAVKAVGVDGQAGKLTLFQ